MSKILRRVLALARTVVESVEISDGSVVVDVRPHSRERLRCPACGPHAALAENFQVHSTLCIALCA